MGPRTGHIEEGTRKPPVKLSTRDRWMLNLAPLDGDPATQLQIDLPMKGWVVDTLKFLDTEKLGPTIIPLRPGNSLLPWSDEAKARQQQNAWRMKYGQDVVYLLVPDASQPGENPWLAQPVRTSWLGLTETDLQDRYIAFKGQPEELMYRAAYIARTGRQPA